MEILNHMHAWGPKAFLCNQLNPERSRAAAGLKFEPDFLLYSKLRSVYGSLSSLHFRPDGLTDGEYYEVLGGVPFENKIK